MDKSNGDWGKSSISSLNKVRVETTSDSIYSRRRIRLPKIEVMYNRDNGNTYQKNLRNIRKAIKILLILCIAFSILNLVVKAIEPILNQECIALAKSIATKITNDQTTKVMENYQYDDLVNIIKDEQGNIKMIGTNVITVNRIIASIPINMQQELEKSENSSFGIRLGSFTGNKLLAGRGPKVNIKMETVGSLETNLKSEFKAEGINQTLHRIYLEVKCRIVILTPYNTIEETILSQVLLVEGLIVGEIPNTYYNLEGLTKENTIDIIE